MQAQMWRRIKLSRVPGLLQRGWEWTRLGLDRGRRRPLCLVNPHGTVWEFRLKNHAYVRRVEAAELEEN